MLRTNRGSLGIRGGVLDLPTAAKRMGCENTDGGGGRRGVCYAPDASGTRCTCVMCLRSTNVMHVMHMMIVKDASPSGPGSPEVVITRPRLRSLNASDDVAQMLACKDEGWNTCMAATNLRAITVHSVYHQDEEIGRGLE